MRNSIETANLILRPFTMEDVNPYFEMVQDPEIKNYTNGAYVADLKEAEFYFEMCFTKTDLKSDSYIAIEEKKSGKLIGGIFVTENYSKNFNVAYFIDKDFRNKGYMQEALEAFLKEAHLPNTLVFDVHQSNTHSLSIMRKIDGIREIYLDPCLQTYRFYYNCK